MTPLRVAAASLALAATTLTAVYSQQNDDFCATTPPPRGLVARCQGLTLTVPASEDALRKALTDWIGTCVSKGRAATIVEDADDSVTAMWALMKDLPRTRSITILPDYEPLSFTRAGQTCYGVESASFTIKGARGIVDLDGEIDATYIPPPSTGLVTDPTDAQIKEAAAAAIKALENSSVRDNSGLPRFRGVLDGMTRYGSSFDDTWYNIAPTPPTGDACYNNFGRGCLPTDQALKNCTRRLRVELVTHYTELKDKPERFRDAMEGLNSQLFRSFQYFRQMHAAETAAPFCPVLHQVLMPKVAEIAGKGRTTLYAYY